MCAIDLFFGLNPYLSLTYGRGMSLVSSYSIYYWVGSWSYCSKGFLRGFYVY